MISKVQKRIETGLEETDRVRKAEVDCNCNNHSIAKVSYQGSLITSATAVLRARRLLTVIVAFLSSKILLKMTSDFPSIAFSSAQSKWIGKSCIVSPSVRRALDNWELTRQKKVLDVGCGTGHIGHDILVHGASEVVGLDSSEEMIEIARDTFKDKRHQFLHGSMLSADLHGFDVAVAFFSLHFVKNKEELTKAIQNISASLKSSGILVATVPNGVKDYNPKREEGQKFGAAINLESDTNLYDGRRLRVEFFENGEMVGSSQVTFFFNETYEQILREAGFRKVEFLPPVISEDGIKKYGEQFFHSYMNPPKDIIIRAFKEE